MKMPPDWKFMEPGDIPAVCAIAGWLHTALPERAEVFAEKLQLFPEGCRKLVAGEKLVGYGFAHPWLLASAPKLDTLLEALPAHPACLYIHDVAILPEARGYGAAGGYVASMEALALSLRLWQLTLVSVYGTAPLWAKYGFKPVSFGLPLASYGPGAAYMYRELRSPDQKN
jgi:hypothetical protein